MSRLLAATALLLCVGFVLATLTTSVGSDPIQPGAMRVIDGDTIEVLGGNIIRLVGFDAPERDSQCAAERHLANRATLRLAQIISGGGLDLRIVRCSCPPGTEGTPRCNHGHSCGALMARGRDVGAVLIAEGLARAYVCGATSCPPPASWCS